HAADPAEYVGPDPALVRRADDERGTAHVPDADLPGRTQGRGGERVPRNLGRRGDPGGAERSSDRALARARRAVLLGDERDRPRDGPSARREDLARELGGRGPRVARTLRGARGGAGAAEAGVAARL